MVSRVSTIAFQGIETVKVEVQTQFSNGMVAFNMVGLPDKAVAESKERVRSALHSLGVSMPPQRITINLAPADLLKEGSHFDLPIALGLMAKMDMIPEDMIERYICLGELALDGSIQPVNGILPAALFANKIDKGLICPKENGSEAIWAGKNEILAASHLLELINHFKGAQMISPPQQPTIEQNEFMTDLSEIKGQETAKRALEITAAGGHNLMMIGPPGTGKSMLASRLPTILPELTPQEAIEVTTIHSIAGMLNDKGLVYQRPYRAPHHSLSMPALVGGGQRAKPGEISLAHHGVLFMDEFPEFNRQSLEALRQPLETHDVTVSRANYHYTYPARIQLIAAMNPCRCGYLADPGMACSKAPRCGQEYQSKISGPLLDRFDCFVEMMPVNVKDLIARDLPTETSQTVRARVSRARNIQIMRFENYCAEQNDSQLEFQLNAYASGKYLEFISVLDEAEQALLNQSIDRFKLSARAYHRILRLARTIADLVGSEHIGKGHLSEAISYRRILPQLDYGFAA